MRKNKLIEVFLVAKFNIFHRLLSNHRDPFQFDTPFTRRLHSLTNICFDSVCGSREISDSSSHFGLTYSNQRGKIDSDKSSGLKCDMEIYKKNLRKTLTLEIHSIKKTKTN